MTCGQVKQMLIDLALAEAGPAERKRVQDHLQECEACRGRLADLDLTRKLLLEGLPQEEVPRRIAFVAANEGAGLFGRSGLWRRAFAVPVGVAAAVALLVGRWRWPECGSCWSRNAGRLRSAPPSRLRLRRLAPHLAPQAPARCRRA